MRVLALILAGLIGIGLLSLVRATIDFHYRRQEEKDHLEIRLTVAGGLWHLQMQIPTARLEWEKGPQLEVKEEVQTKTGEEKEASHRLRSRYFDCGFFFRLWPKIPGFLRTLHRIKNRFYRGIHCTFLDWEAKVGSEDAAWTAIAAGSFWSLFGFSLARLYRQVTMDTARPRILVIPDFNHPGFFCRIHCIFNLRIGHIMLVGLDLVRAFIRGKGGRL